MFTTLEDVENERQQALDFDTSLIDRLYSLQEEARQDDESYKQQMIEQHGPKFLETGLPTPPSTFSLAPLLSMYKSQSVSRLPLSNTSFDETATISASGGRLILCDTNMILKRIKRDDETRMKLLTAESTNT